MDRVAKEELVASLHQTFSETTAVVVTHYSGLSVAEMTELRAQMRGAGANVKVTKNRLTKRALAGTRYEGLGEMFTGPTAIAYSADPVAAAKITIAFAKTHPKLIVIGGGLGEKVLDAEGITLAGHAAVAGRAARQAHRPDQRAGHSRGGRAAGPGRAARAGVLGLCRDRRGRRAGRGGERRAAGGVTTTDLI